MIHVALVLGLGGYFALLLWCRKQGNMVIPWSARIVIGVRRFMAAFEPLMEAFARSAEAHREFDESMARVREVCGSDHMRGLAADVSMPPRLIEDADG